VGQYYQTEGVADDLKTPRSFKKSVDGIGNWLKENQLVSIAGRSGMDFLD
jgi:hypothetical protein